jgi:hypothetical protein
MNMTNNDTTKPTIYAYVSSYCNFPHRMADGKPIKHECRVIPPRALKAERDGDIAGAIDIMQRERRPRTHRGTKS